MKKVAALFVESNGVYFNIKNVIPYDIKKNALTFDMDFPVIAHPPCQLWGKFAKINYLRWGGDHNKPGNDNGLFEFALKKVKQNGGVLEHPASSYAFDYFSIPKPINYGWNKISKYEYVCEVWQSAYGHLANKKTWLFYVGPKPFELNWEKIKGTHQIGFRDQRGIQNNKPTLRGKIASRTPIKFRDELIKLARLSI